jgi:two-component system chemotaxis response regulator CheY
VDDSRAMRMIVLRELRKAGYDDLEEAENPVVALERLHNPGIELVVSDWNMPEMTGIEMLNRLRSDGNKVAFGFVTSESADDIRRQAFEAGADFIVTKPFSGDDLGRQISQALGGSGNVGGGFTGSQETVADVIEGLTGRRVTTKTSPPPSKDLARTIAVYKSPDGSKTSYGVFEMPLAASVGCALSRMSPAEAAQWSEIHALPQNIEANFYEVANVLAKFAATGTERCILKELKVVFEFKQLPELKEATEWLSSMEVEIAGYPKGRVGFIAP